MRPRDRRADRVRILPLDARDEHQFPGRNPPQIDHAGNCVPRRCFLLSRFMHKPRFLDHLAAEGGDRNAFSSQLARERRAFQPAHVEPQWARDRVADIRHIKLEVTLDFGAKSIAGTATHRLAAILDGVTSLEFDAAELEVTGVKAGGEPAAFETADRKLKVTRSRALRAGEETEVALAYCEHPRRGLYFIGPDEGYPNKPVEAWPQGEDEDS